VCPELLPYELVPIRLRVNLALSQLHENRAVVQSPIQDAEMRESLRRWIRLELEALSVDLDLLRLNRER
jgi:hypothetical protein